MHGFAGAIDAALGIEIGVDRAGRGAAADAAVGQIEGRAAQIEEAEIAVVAIGHHHDGLVAAGAAEQAGIEIGAADRIGRGAWPDMLLSRATSVSLTPLSGLALA